jgi:hypothetical protein
MESANSDSNGLTGKDTGQSREKSDVPPARWNAPSETAIQGFVGKIQTTGNPDQAQNTSKPSA